MAPGVSSGLPQRPVANSAVEMFLWEKHQREHKKKIERSKTNINNTWSREEDKKLQKSRRNGKKEMQKEERFANIERENMRMLVRFHEINKKGGATKAAAQLALSSQPNKARGSSLPAAGSRANARVRELQRIDAENQKLLKRLEKAKPSVKLNKWEQEHREQQKIMRMRMESYIPEPQKGPLPFGRLFPPSPSAVQDVLDEECDALQRLQEHLRHQAYSPSSGSRAERYPADLGEEGEPEEPRLEEEEGFGEGGPAADAEGRAEPPARQAPPEAFAGTIPQASRDLAEALMAEHFRDQAEPEDADAEQAAEDAKEAAAAALRAAVMVEVGGSDLLSYENVIQQRRPLVRHSSEMDEFAA